MILKATDFSPENPFIRDTPRGNDIHRQILHIYDARGNEFEHAVEMTGRLYTMLALFMHVLRTPAARIPRTAMYKKALSTSPQIIPTPSPWRILLAMSA